MASNEPAVRIGVDVGGTFTDLVLHDARTNTVHTGKLLTTPVDPSEAIIGGVKRILDEKGYAAADVHSIVHGTTLVTNAVIERKGAKIGLITTAGFRDVIEVGREIRYDLYDLFLDAPPNLVPRHRRLEVEERIDANGEIVVALAAGAAREAARRLVEEHGVEAIAIGFLNSYRNPEHERRAASEIREIFPDLPLSLSSEVATEIREYERFSTACANAYVQPVVERYLDRLERRLAEVNFRGRLYVMLSAGGIASVQEAKIFPIRLLESGPAAGAMAASFIATRAGFDKVVSFDMGGTTAKMCLVENGAPNRKYDFEAGRLKRFAKGSGLPLKISVVDMIEIGAGGGSIARINVAADLMKVGPTSAGAMPGPVCYDRGGTEPTVTDSDLVLGRLDAKYFLGGEMPLDVKKVEAAIDRSLGEHLKIATTDAALGVQRIVDETMAAATRVHLAEKGKDPRKYALIAFGGAGPVHAFNLARLLKINQLVVPLGAGVASALGFLVAPPATDLARSYVVRLERVDWHVVERLYAEMKEKGIALLRDAGAQASEIELHATADMRHVGQGFEISVPLPSIDLDANAAEEIAASFYRVYEEKFGRVLTDLPIEVLTWRLECIAPARPFNITPRPARAGSVKSAKRGQRDVIFDGVGAQLCDIYDRYALVPGDAFEGPALVEERESTCVIGPNSRVRIDQNLNLLIELI